MGRITRISARGQGGFRIVLGSRIGRHQAMQPQATDDEAYEAAMATIKSACVPLRIDAVVAGAERDLAVIASLPTDEQIAAGNDALELEFLDVEGGEAVEFGDPVMGSWVADCSEELYEAVHAYFESQV